MDLSKLPKLSSTATTPPDVSQPSPVAAQPSASSPAVVPYAPREPAAGSGAEAWISIVVGIILMLITPRIFEFFAHRNTFDQLYQFSDKDGNPLAYTASAFFLQDLGVAIFALVLVLDGVVLLAARTRWLVAVILCLTVLSTLFNLYVVATTRAETGLPLICALAVAFGGYIAIYQWRAFAALRMLSVTQAAAS